MNSAATAPATGIEPGWIARALSKASVSGRSHLARQSTPSSNPHKRDSLENGAWIGAAVGAGVGYLGGSIACAEASFFSPEEPSCGSTQIASAALFAGIGALIGVGIDALFDVAPYPAGTSHPGMKGLRVRLRF